MKRPSCAQSAARAIDWREADMEKFIIEREIPEVGSLDRAQLKAAATKSNEALARLAPYIQWIESYVADDKTFFVPRWKRTRS